MAEVMWISNSDCLCRTCLMEWVNRAKDMDGYGAWRVSVAKCSDCNGTYRTPIPWAEVMSNG